MLNLHRGLNNQATIIATPPLIGLFGTVDQIMAGCSSGFVGKKWTIMKLLRRPLSSRHWPRPCDTHYLVSQLLSNWVPRCLVWVEPSVRLQHRRSEPVQ